jgi:hypothetical protein
MSNTLNVRVRGQFRRAVLDSAEGGFSPGLAEVGYVAPKRRGRPSDITAIADASVQLDKPIVLRASEARFEAVKRALGLNKRFVSVVNRVTPEGEAAEEGVLFTVTAQIAEAQSKAEAEAQPEAEALAA